MSSRFNFDSVKIKAVPDPDNLDAYLNEDHGHPTIFRVNRMLRQDAKAELTALFTLANESLTCLGNSGKTGQVISEFLDNLRDHIKCIGALIDADPKLTHRHIVALLEDASRKYHDEMSLKNQ